MLSVTTRDIAAHTGYGQSTVSMALRDDPRIPEATRRLIHRAAAELGYQPDPHFSRLMGKVKRRVVDRSPQPLGFAIPWPSPSDYFAYRSYREYREGARARAVEFGYDLEDFLVGDPGLPPARLSHILRTRAIPGLILAPASLPYESTAGHGLELDLPCQFHATSAIGFSIAAPQVHRVSHDHAFAAQLSFNTLRERGYRRIGLVTSRSVNVRVGGRWLAGFLLAQHDLPGAEKLPPLILDHIRNAPTFDRWLKRHSPDSILTVEYEETADHLGRSGLRIPEDIAIAHLDAGSATFSCAGIDQCNHQIGSAAFDVLLAQILRNERGIPPLRRTVMLEGQWQEGPSLRTRDAAITSHGGSRRPAAPAEARPPTSKGIGSAFQ